MSILPDAGSRLRVSDNLEALDEGGIAKALDSEESDRLGTLHQRGLNGWY